MLLDERRRLRVRSRNGARVKAERVVVESGASFHSADGEAVSAIPGGTTVMAIGPVNFDGMVPVEWSSHRGANPKRGHLRETDLR